MIGNKAKQGREKKPRKIFKVILFTFFVASLIVIVFLLGVVRQYRTTKAGGKVLNHNAWEAAFIERGQAVPAEGPREGYWGSRISNLWFSDGEINIFRHPEIKIPGKIDLNSDGWQIVGEDFEQGTPTLRLMILGGSVAWGANASSLETTYFYQLRDNLKQRGFPVKVINVSIESITSYQELLIFEKESRRQKPDAVLFLTGLNDLTTTDDPKADTVATCLRNMEQMIAIARKNDIAVILAPQPFLPFKKDKSAYEKRILELPLLPWTKTSDTDWVALHKINYSRLVSGFQDFAKTKGVYFLDASRVFDNEQRTVFADFWHFSDPGQIILGKYLAEKLIPTLKTVLIQKGRL